MPGAYALDIDGDEHAIWRARIDELVAQWREVIIDLGADVAASAELGAPS